MSIRSISYGMKEKGKRKKEKGKGKRIVYTFTTWKIIFLFDHPLALAEGERSNISLTNRFFLSPPPLVVADTLSLGDRTMDNTDRHGGQGRPRNQMLDPPNMKLKVEPTFDYSQNTNVTALIGKTAYLTCRVRNLGDKSVRFLHFHRPFFRVRISSARPSSLSPTFISYSCFRVGIRDIAPGKLFKTG